MCAGGACLDVPLLFMAKTGQEIRPDFRDFQKKADETAKDAKDECVYPAKRALLAAW
jgi:hypothetical protein